MNGAIPVLPACAFIAWTGKTGITFYMLDNEVIRRIWSIFCRGRSIHCHVRWPPDTWLITSAYHIIVMCYK
jgi:hypothetical protein